MLTRYLVALVCVFFALSAPAQVPNTFVSGQAAVAEDVNENFSALVTEIQALQTQLDALQSYAGPPTAETIPGTYDFIELAVEVGQSGPDNFSIGSQSGTGTVVLNANGTGTVTSNEGSRQLSFFTQSLSVRNSADNGSQPVNSTDVQLYNQPSSDSGNFTWSFSGNVLTITDEHVMQFYGANGRIFVQGGSDEPGRTSLLVVVRR